jgi:hypothetical protein
MSQSSGASSLNLSNFFTRLNDPIALLLKSPLRFLLDRQLMLVTVTGRKSGKTFTIPVGYQRKNDHILVLVSRASTKQWWRNYRTPWPIIVHSRGRTTQGTAVLVAPEAPEFLEAFQSTFDLMPWLGSQFGVRRTKGRRLDESDRAILAAEGRVIRIDFP